MYRTKDLSLYLSGRESILGLIWQEAGVPTPVIYTSSQIKLLMKKYLSSESYEENGAFIKNLCSLRVHNKLFGGLNIKI